MNQIVERNGQEWTFVKDGLPKNKGKYIVAYHPCYWDDVSEEIAVGEDNYRGGNGKRCWAHNKYQRVIAWMPFPPPPNPPKNQSGHILGCPLDVGYEEKYR